MSAPHSTWPQANQRYLMAALGVLRTRLEARLDGHENADGQAQVEADQEFEAARTALPAAAALQTLEAIFGLSPFERDLLLLSAGVELSTVIAALCARAQGDASRTAPTFGMALAMLGEAHWSAIVPAGALRHWRLLELGPGTSLTASPLRIDERVLHYLAGIQHLDERLDGLLDRVPASAGLAASHQVVADRLARSLALTAKLPSRPIVQLGGTDRPAKRGVAASACVKLGFDLFGLAPDGVPLAAADEDALRRLCDREAALAGLALLIDLDGPEALDRSRLHAVSRFAERLRCPVLVCARDPLVGQRPSVRFDVNRPGQVEQRTLWEGVLGNGSVQLATDLDSVVNHFDMGAESIEAVAVQLASDPETEDASHVTLWDTCRRLARSRLDDLAQRIEPRAHWQDIVLPAGQRGLLHEIAAHARHRSTVYLEWGFASKGQRGLGISALFAGPSGTGKTMAAEVLANELQLDLYHIDLSQVVSKYIGETEKNLGRVFDAAEEGGAILFFDEADALFGKRSEVKDSHDRYANIEVSYLLQRMEAYRGLAILTTNLKSALDPAFLRRIRFVVQFPFPDAAQRADIWRGVFPARTPTEDLDVEQLARLNVAGGSIRNIALNAAFLAMDAGGPVRMADLLRAARTEYAKLDRPLTAAEVGGWG